MINEVHGNELYFAKLREDVKIPTKEVENGGYDIYANFEEDYMVIPPHTTKMIPTGLCSACSSDYVIILKERGSTGTKGIAQRCGVIDSGYRGEWFVPLTNTTSSSIIIAKSNMELSDGLAEENIIYPYEKAICQAMILPVPTMDVKVIDAEELQAIPSKRGQGKLGSSLK